MVTDYCHGNIAINRWLQRPQHIEWELTVGLNGRRRPNIGGRFITNLSYLDDQGEKWGDTYIKIVGQHFDDYAHWNNISTYLPIGGNTPGRLFVPAPFTQRIYKDAAAGVTGLIGEVLVTVFLQTVLKLNPLDMAHLKDDRKAPDICLDIDPTTIAFFIRSSHPLRPISENQNIANTISRAIWNYPIPLECKSRRENGDRQVRGAMLQLLEYWRNIPDIAGYGIFAQIDVNPTTKIRLHLLAPQQQEINNVRRIICGNVGRLPALPVKPTYRTFHEMIGVRLLG